MSAGFEMLETAQKVIQERGSAYGNAKENMEITAKLWSQILKIEVTAIQVSLCLNQLKVARLIQSPKHSDSCTDLVGYAYVLRECQAEK
jgi:predicted secreted protein